MIKSYGIYWLILVLCLAIGIRNAFHPPQGQHRLILDLSVNHGGTGDLFYDTGAGFVPEQRLTTPEVVPGLRESCVIPLPEQQVMRLRWDPPYHADGVEGTLHAATLEYYGGRVRHLLPLEGWVPNAQVSNQELLPDGALYFRLEGASEDPFWVVSGIPSFPSAPSHGASLAKGILFSLIAAAVLSIIARLIQWYFNS
jgi:hypothetical protein